MTFTRTASLQLNRRPVRRALRLPDLHMVLTKSVWLTSVVGAIAFRTFSRGARKSASRVWQSCRAVSDVGFWSLGAVGLYGRRVGRFGRKPGYNEFVYRHSTSEIWFYHLDVVRFESKSSAPRPKLLNKIVVPVEALSKCYGQRIVLPKFDFMNVLRIRDYFQKP